MNQYYVYIMASGYHGTLYIGMTGDLVKRVHQHREGAVAGFTADYKVRYLVWFEIHDDVQQALLREKRLKHWHRAWKIRLIEESNPRWEDLWEQIVGDAALSD
jgi:putative endonuclease